MQVKKKRRGIEVKQLGRSGEERGIKLTLFVA
jgi:hypothetical protein